MIVPMLAFTFASALPMLPVVSARNTMSGCGGTTGVETTFFTVRHSPGSGSRVTDVGSTPGAASVAAVEWPTQKAAAASATACVARERVVDERRCIELPPLDFSVTRARRHLTQGAGG